MPVQTERAASIMQVDAARATNEIAVAVSGLRRFEVLWGLPVMVLPAAPTAAMAAAGTLCDTGGPEPVFSLPIATREVKFVRGILDGAWHSRHLLQGEVQGLPTSPSLKLMRELLGSLLVFAGLMVLSAISCVCQVPPRQPGEIVWAIHYDPKSFDPAKVDEQASELVRYLTGGVLFRYNRQTQQPEAQLAESFHVNSQGTLVVIKLREGLRFSDGSALTSSDVAWSLRRVLAPSTGAVVAAEFLSPSAVKIDTPDKFTVRLHLPQPIIGMGKIFDEIAIEPANRPSEGRVTSGPFTLTDYKRSQYIRLRRNPNYWRHDSAGVQMPYATGIRLDILNNREQETALFLRGEYDVIDGISPDYFGIVAQKSPQSVRDLGASLNTEQLWFNQSSRAPLPGFEMVWFRDRNFRISGLTSDSPV